VTPPGQHLGVFTGVAVGAIASFVVGTVILRLYPVKEQEKEDATSAAPGRAQQPAAQPA